MNKKYTPWMTTCNRFVAYFDIMGFKDMVLRNGHEEVVQKMKDVRNGKKIIFDGTKKGLEMNTNLKSFQFSDSFFIFSKSDSPQDTLNILHQSMLFFNICIGMHIPLKGVISYGKVTADFKNQIFVGQPIIDAYLLHDELEMYGAILDFNADKKLSSFLNDKELGKAIESEIVRYKAPTKNGNISHYCLNWPGVLVSAEYDGSNKRRKMNQQKMIFPLAKYNVEKFYYSVSGKPRKYVDNTVEFIDYLIKKAKDKYPDIHTIEIHSNNEYLRF